jgi:hypothetical protein
MTQFGWPMFPTLLATMGLPLSTNGLNAGSLGLHWKARNDSLKIGRSHVRAYRLETKLLDR